MFKNAVNLFEIFGFKIRVDPSWLILFALIVWSLSTSYFPEIIEGLGQGGVSRPFFSCGDRALYLPYPA